MPHDLDETRLADAVRAFWSDPEPAASAGIRAAIAAWEASAPKAEPATEEQITGAWGRFCCHVESQSQAFHAGVRWAESRQPRAEPKPEPPRSSMTKAERRGLLFLLDLASINSLNPELAGKAHRLVTAIRAETHDAE